MTNPTRSRKRWRIALAVVVLFAVVGWLVAWPAYLRHSAMRDIERVGGRVVGEFHGPQWLQKLGIQFESDYAITLEGSRVTDESLRHLGSMKNLEVLVILDANVGDHGLRHIGTMKNLQQLYLHDSRITDDGLKHLSDLPALEVLSLKNAHINGEGLKHLGGLSNLLELSLDGTMVGDDGLRHLSVLTNLESLYLDNTQVTDRGLKHLKAMTSLYKLPLKNTLGNRSRSVGFVFSQTEKSATPCA